MNIQERLEYSWHNKIFTTDLNTACCVELSFIPTEISLEFLQPLSVGVPNAYRKKGKRNIIELESLTQTDTNSPTETLSKLIVRVKVTELIYATFIESYVLYLCGCKYQAL